MKTVVITGSSKGFGLEMGKEFLNQGYHVAFSGSNEQNLNNAIRSITFDGEKVASMLCDVRNRGDLQNLWDVIFKKMGKN